MSRLAKKPIHLPEEVSFSQKDGLVEFRGPRGSLSVKLLPGISIKQEENKIWVTQESKKGSSGKALLGTAWALARNAAIGVKEGFSKTLELEGVGYRAAMDGGNLVLHLGYAVPVQVKIPGSVSVSVEKNTITVSGIDKELVGQVASDIRSKKKPEPYKGKGIRYKGEVVRRKAGKKAAAAAA